MTGDISIEPSRAAMYRLACHFVLSHLPIGALDEAFRSLYDIYEWHQTLAEQNPESHSPPDVIIRSGPPVVMLEAKPFVFGD